MTRLRSLLALFLALCAAEALRAQPDTPAAQVRIERRASEIRNLINANRRWSGGHSPIPRRAIVASTLEAAAARLVEADATALCELTLDNAYDMRAAAAALLARLTPQAESLIEARAQRETDAARRSRLKAALIEIAAARALAAQRGMSAQ